MKRRFISELKMIYSPGKHTACIDRADLFQCPGAILFRYKVSRVITFWLDFSNTDRPNSGLPLLV